MTDINAAADKIPTKTKETAEKIDLTGDGGVIKQILREGTGETPSKGHKVYVHYVGKLLDGSKFDSSRDRDDEFSFKLGQGSVIKGWDVGVATMKVGELALLTCRSDYAYGKNGSPPKIPSDATLEFEVELLSFAEEEKQEWEMSSSEKLETAEKKKEEGNIAFKAGDYKKAKNLYDKAASLTRLLDDFDDLSEGDTKDPSQSEAKAKAKQIYIASMSNEAACLLKLEEYRSCVDMCGKVLESDPNNIKAFFRRGLAYMYLGEFDASRQSFNKALELDPQNVEAKKELTRLEKKAAEHLANEKKMFKNMFR